MRKRRPSAWAALRTRNSGDVFFCGTRDINRERRSGVSRSTSHSAAAAKAGTTPSLSAMAENSARAMIGDTLFPIILKLCQTVG